MPAGILIFGFVCDGRRRPLALVTLRMARIAVESTGAELVVGPCLTLDTLTRFQHIVPSGLRFELVAAVAQSGTL